MCLVGSAVLPDGDGHLFWDLYFSSLQLRSVNILSFMILWSWISPLGLGVSCGMGG